jgi:beta-lactamase regulating signal transducer with metallopeptidase domain
MNTPAQYAFNLIFNASFSFFAGIFIIFLSIKLFRINNSRWKLLLLSLPFLKILVDLAYRGIPTSSVVYSGINPLNLPPKHQTLTIGAGFSEYGPIFNLVFSANNVDGKRYSASGADYLFALLAKHFGTIAPVSLLLITLMISAFFVLRRFWTSAFFEQIRRTQRKNGKSLGDIQLDWRKVDIYSTRDYEGTPFTGGIFKPYICLPSKTIERLTPEERDAVIKHEIAHIKHWDLFVTMAIKSLGDLFWFIPGYRFLSRKIDRLREILADEYAVTLGAVPAHLASALLKLKEIPEGAHHAVLHSAFFREKALLKTRVESLLSEQQVRARFGWNNKYLKVLITVWIAGAVMTATFGGNHDVATHDIPPWAERLMKKIGLM